MAILSSDKKSVTVQKNDTLSQIALDYKQYIDPPKTYQYLASINGIANPNLIYVGQVIKLTKNASSPSSNTKTDSNKATITAFGLQSNSDSTLFATWKWDKKNTENYETSWKYDTGDGVWFENFSTTDLKQATYSYPSNAKRVKFNVKPVSKTYTNNGKETKYWSAGWSTDKIFDVSSRPPTQAPTPRVELENFKITATLENLDIYATRIQFQIVKDNDTIFNNGTVEIKTGYASYSCSVNAGSDYKVRCRGVKGNVYGEWSDYSDNYGTGPAASGGITVLKALSDTSIHVEWSAVKNATSYKIEYTTKKIYFDSSNDVQSKEVDATKVHHAEITGLQSGEEYFFRVQAINKDGESAWTEIKSIVIGKKPVAPTTWSSTTTAISGEKLVLYWVHNAQDGSSQTFAELELEINNVLKTYTIENTRSEEEKDKTSFYEIDTKKYKEGTKILWRVRTAGITKTYGDWSIQRTIDVYAPPTLTLSIRDVTGNIVETITSFPFTIRGVAGPNTQAPIGYYLAIASDEIYETVDNVGNPKIVNKGEVVYSKYFNEKESLNKELSAGDVNLENNISYTVTCIVSMNSGLTAEAIEHFTVSWDELEFDVNAEVSVDNETASTSIRPYCARRQIGYFEAILGKETYELTETRLDVSKVDNVYTTTGEIVYMGSTGQGLYYCMVYYDSDGKPIDPKYRAVANVNGEFIITTTVLNPKYIEDVRTKTGETVTVGYLTENNSSTRLIYYCIAEEHSLVEGVALSVYRREFDGSFTEIATGIDNTKKTFVTDPHPALDFARYRIVGVEEVTGAVSYTDLAGIPMNEKAVIIQWDEQWSTFDITNEDEMEQPPWSGSLLRLPYNVDVSDNHSLDVSLVEYIGRKHPVSYYGTQVGKSATWNVEIDKKDEETLYALRRLALWMGDVYVREPSGSGYWANISVSFSQKHCEVTIPVSFSITRVEGGI